MNGIIRRQSEHLDNFDSPSPYEDTESTKWGEWTSLRTECENLEIERFYRRYVQRLEMSTLSLFLVIHLVIVLAHIIFLLTSSSTDATPDVYAYVISIVCVFLTQILVFKTKKYNLVTFSMSYITVAIIILTDIAVPIYHNLNSVNAPTLRPAYPIYVILCIYIFLPITYNYLTLLLGFVTSVCYLVVLTMITYQHDDNIVTKVISDAIVFIVLNIIGIHYRFMNEIALRRTFLDRRNYVQSNILLKKERDQEKDLLLSILPEHTAHELENDIIEVIQKIRRQKNNKLKTNMEGGTINPQTQRLSMVQLRGVAINKTYTEVHENVSVLYADIVNYTTITTTLEVDKLVEILHELFVKFDEASHNNNVLRIKFLGDCYYAVAGVPKKNEHHARSCVELGLQMIKDIREVCVHRNVDIDMRIGVHSGNIIAGVIGACKWQYDIWSKDVDIASRMESTGRAGKVHVSKQTLDQLNNEYYFEPGTENARTDPILISNNIETFLISPVYGIEIIAEDNRRLSVGLHEHLRRSIKRKSKTLDTRNFMQNTMTKFKELITQTNAEMEREAEQMPVGRLRFNKMCSKKNFQRTPEQNLEQKNLAKVSPLLLMFNNGSLEMEMNYSKQYDILLKYNVVLGFVVLLAIITLQIINELTNPIFWAIVLISCTINLFLIPIIWFKKIWIMRNSNEESEHNIFINPKSRLLNYVYDVSIVFAENTGMRYIVFLLMGLSLAVSSIAYLVTEETVYEISRIKNTWAITHCILLMLCMNFLFTKIHFIFKFFTGTLVTVLYGWIIFDLKWQIFNTDKTINPILEANLSQFMTLVAVILLLHLVDRQMEFIARVDYNANQQLLQKQIEAEESRISNAILLQNILPAHVAAIYVDDSFREEFYHEKYENVAIMFAQIMNYKVQSDKQGLSILNQIICDFDEVLLSLNSNLRLEKIKIAGWTYMVACGLDPARNLSTTSLDKKYIDYNGGRRSTSRNFSRRTTKERLNRPTRSSTNKSTTLSRFSQNVSCVMAQFALDLMKSLHDNSDDNFKEYDPALLRVGISSGQVVAGVIGSNKPLYDVWGDTVNMASRMESSGTPGRIQVTTETAETLKSFDIACEYGGQKKIKGKNELVDTHYVLFDENYEFIKISKQGHGERETTVIN